MTWKNKYKSRPALVKRIDKYLERNRFVVPIISIDTMYPIGLEDIKVNVNGFIALQMYYFLKEDSDFANYIHSKIQRM